MTKGLIYPCRVMMLMMVMVVVVEVVVAAVVVVVVVVVMMIMMISITPDSILGSRLHSDSIINHRYFLQLTGDEKIAKNQ